MNDASWYELLTKPSWAPPSFLFGPVWTVLYVIIAITYGYVLYLFIQKKIPFIVLLPFLLNLIFNFLYTPLQFGLQNLTLAAIDIVLVLGTLIWALCAIYPYSRKITYANIPYVLWVSFATVLQFTILFLN